MTTITITYEISDGYIGKSRPQTFEADTSDFYGLNESEIGNLVQEMTDDDMRMKVSADIVKFDETVTKIAQMCSAEEADE